MYSNQRKEQDHKSLAQYSRVSNDQLYWNCTPTLIKSIIKEKDIHTYILIWVVESGMLEQRFDREEILQALRDLQGDKARWFHRLFSNTVGGLWREM